MFDKMFYVLVLCSVLLGAGFCFIILTITRGSVYEKPENKTEAKYIWQKDNRKIEVVEWNAYNAGLIKFILIDGKEIIVPVCNFGELTVNK